ncbi:MAG: hypothetical protein LQ340_003992 [Diploschistes diacapsis]|nr:MAG: hypothetical protein LQ340_003992 [Diploschistes diacapsis]
MAASTSISPIVGFSTALSLAEVDTQLHSDGSRGAQTPARSLRSMSSRRSFRSTRAETPTGQYRSRATSEAGETTSIRSFAPTAGHAADAESILGELLVTDQRSPGWKFLNGSTEKDPMISAVPFDTGEPTADFNREFDEIPEIDQDGDNEGDCLGMWRSKRKHYLILSAAGKPIYNRHGSDNLISGSIGIIQTILSFFEGFDDQLKSFTAGGSRFVVITRGPLYLVAITKLGESDSQLRVQLEALYMQILSTLTLPTLSNLFSKRPSTDLRRPLEGTESLLSALADSFTRGSPPALLSALECLKIKKRHREAINQTLLKNKCKDLLYGLIVAGGRLVSVVRPRTHSLHPGDLQLIFNMLFEAGGVKASEGENWIPMCLPGFNKNGYLYMYVSFLDVPEEREREEVQQSSTTSEDRIAMLLISANKESFYELREMRDKIVEDLEETGELSIIKSAVLAGRPSATDILPGTMLQHFLYKSRSNLQYFMPSYKPTFNTLLERRRLLSLYHTLHSSLHSKPTHQKVHYILSREFSALAWATPVFELYCVASPTTARNALAQSANRLVQWVRREEERIFIIGGAIF